MEIKTKFSINDKAWFMRNNAVESGRVKQIFTKVEIGVGINITYVVDDYHNMLEEHLFASKEELLKSF